MCECNKVSVIFNTNYGLCEGAFKEISGRVVPWSTPCAAYPVAVLFCIASH